MAPIRKTCAILLVLYLTEYVLSIDVPKSEPRKAKGINNNQVSKTENQSQLLFETGTTYNFEDTLQVSECLVNALNLRYNKEKVEDALSGYVFKNKNILLRAVLHENYQNKIRQKSKCGDKNASYRTLEYIGNFVLHYVLSRYILVENKITDRTEAHKAKARLETNLVSAYLAVKDEFNQLLYIDAAEEIQKINDIVTELDQIKSIPELEKKGNEKQKLSVLPSLFKSLAGAVYVDNAFKIEKVEEIFTAKYKRNSGD